MISSGIDPTLQSIIEHPEYFGFIDEKKIIRDVKLRHFPYLVVYEFDNDKVIVYSVFNGYKSPDKKFPDKYHGR